MARRLFFATHEQAMGPFAMLSMRASPRRPSVREVAAQMLKNEPMAVVRGGPAMVSAIPNPSVPGAFIEAPGWAAALQGGFSGLGYLGDVPVAAVTFTNHDAADDFVRGVTLRGSAGRWEGMSQSILSNVDAAISQAQGPRGQLEVERYKAMAQPIATRISRDLQPFGMGGRSETQDLQYRSAMQELKNLMLYAPERISAAAFADTAGPMAPVQEVQIHNQAAQTVDIQSRQPSVNTPEARGDRFFQTTSAGGALPLRPALQPRGKSFPWVPVLVAGGIVLVGGAMLLRRR